MTARTGYSRLERTVRGQTHGYDLVGNHWVDTTNAPATGQPRNFCLDPAAVPQSASWFNRSTNRPAGNLKLANPYMVNDAAENRTITAVSTGDRSSSDDYDGEGTRVRQITCAGSAACTSASSGAAVTVYVYDAAGHLAAEYRSQPETNQPSGTQYVSGDHLGSTRLTTNAAGGHSISSVHGKGVARKREKLSVPSVPKQKSAWQSARQRAVRTVHAHTQTRRGVRAAVPRSGRRAGAD